MKTSALTLAVLLLIGDAQATKLYRQPRGRNLAQYLDGDFDDLNQDMVQEQQTHQSVEEAEKQLGKQIKTDQESISESLDHYTKMNFEADGETFAKAGNVADGLMVQVPTFHQMTPEGGVWLIQSDPIHGSIGPPKPKMEDLTPEQQFEVKQRNKKPVVFKDDKEQVTWTDESLKWAEENTGGKMPEPDDPKEKKKVKKTPEYHLADSDDEDEDTVETRRSVKTAEKYLKRRFFINAKEKAEYDKAFKSGKISEEQMDFKEDEDEALGPKAAGKEERKAKKAKANYEEYRKKAQDKKKANKQKKEEEEEADKEEAIAKAKEERPDNQVPAKKQPEKPDDDDDESGGLAPIAAPKVTEAAAQAESSTPEELSAPGEVPLPPDLRGALAQQKHRASAEEQEDQEEEEDQDEEQEADQDQEQEVEEEENEDDDDDADDDESDDE